MIKIKYFPAPSAENDYIENNIKIIEGALGYKIKTLPKLKDLILNFSFKHFKRSDILVVNWTENYLRSKNNQVTFSSILKYLFHLLFFKLITKKIIYIRHNLYPHGLIKTDIAKALRIISFFEKFCDIKVSHSGHLIKEGYFYLPHPLYNLSPPQDYALQADNYYIMFGRIEAYKKVDEVIKAWNVEDALVIAGPCNDEKYLKQLKKISINKNIRFDIRFIPNQEAENLVGFAKGLILGHTEKNMIVSGSFFYAISLGTPVFASNTPFFSWLINEANFYGLSTFERFDELNERLLVPNNINRKLITSNANELFGDEQIKEEWLKLFNLLNK